MIVTPSSTILSVDEIRCVFLSQSSVEVLHTIYFDCMSHVLRGYLEDPIILELLCDNNHLPVQPDFRSFLKAYNRKHMLVEKQYEWYVMYHLHDIPITKALKRAARYQYYETLNEILDRERLWCSKIHIEKVCVEVYANDPKSAEGYLSHILRQGRDVGKKYVSMVLGRCETKCIKRGMSVDVEHITHFCAAEIALGNRHWELARRYYGEYKNRGGVLPLSSPNRAVLNQKRYDLLEVFEDSIRVRDLPEDFIEDSTIPGNTLSSINTIKQAIQLRELGMKISVNDIDSIDDYEFGGIEVLKLFKYLREDKTYSYPIELLLDPESTEDDIAEVAIGVVINSKDVTEALEYMRTHHPYTLTKYVLATIFHELRYDYDPYTIRKMVEWYPYLLVEDAYEQLLDLFVGDGPMTEWLTDQTIHSGI